MRARFLFPYLLLVVCLFVFLFGCDSRDGAKSAGLKEYVPLEPYQAELLHIAFQSALAMPAKPHIKDKSRLQQYVVKACLELKQPKRALEYIEQIDNWRRGAAYADLALYYAQDGAMKEKVEPYLNKAAQIAEKNEDWRRDRIRVKIAQAHILLGQHKQARVFAAGVVDSESGKVARTDAITCSEDSFDKEMESLEKVVLSGQFDAVKNTLGAYTELFNRFYADIERRAIIENKIKAAFEAMPIIVRIEILIEMTDFALAHSDQAKALELVNEAGKLMDSASWEPRHSIPLKAKLAELRFLAGEQQRARSETEEALSIFDTKREKIVNIYRARILRSIAETYHEMGETVIARDLYKRMLEAGIENPNSRPRAEDLAATCCSMALHKFKPDAKLFNRIREIHNDLGDPW